MNKTSTEGWEKRLRLTSRGLIFFAGLLFAFQGLQAQIEDGEDEAESPFTVQDSIGKDSLEVQKEVRILTEWFDLGAMEAGWNARKGVHFDLDNLMYFDHLERTDGFYVSLGQIGKPYRRYHYGVDAGFLREGNFINPYTGEEDVYMMDQEREVRYYDTRTPFININYGQGKSDLSGLKVEVAQNINPWWNISVLFRREQCAGTYSEFATSHHNIYVATNLRSRNERYHLFLNGFFQELLNEVNGGVAQIDSIPNLFNKRSQPISLSDADLVKRQNSVYLKHYYSLVKSDSLEKPHKLLVYNSVMRDFFINQYADTIISSTVQQYSFPVYLTLDDSADYLYERYQHGRWSVAGGVTYRFHKQGFTTGHQFQVLNETVNFDKNNNGYLLNKVIQEYKGSMDIEPGAIAVHADLEFQVAASNYFTPENLLNGNVSISFPEAVSDYTYKIAKEKNPGDPKPDSVEVEQLRRPFIGFMSVMNYDRNPSIQQSFGAGWEGNSFNASRDFGNRRLELFKVGIGWRGKSRKTNYGGLPGSEVRLTGFRSRQYGMIFPNQEMVLEQTPDNAYLEFLGGELDMRLRMGKWVLETNTTLQSPTAVGDETLFDYYLTTHPNFYTRAKIYWEAHDLKVARAIRGGLEYHYFSAFNAPVFDGPSQMFFPQTRLEQTGYHRLDAFFLTQIKKAQLFFRIYNTLEGVFDSGYYTTLFYPMWDRNFMVGVNWSFYD